MGMTCANRLFHDDAGGQTARGAGAKPSGGLVGRYRALRERLSDMLARGDRDYSALTALSQEIGRMRRKIREKLERRRQARKA
jgi:hypothetical protein